MSLSRREFLIGTATAAFATRSNVSASPVDYEFKIGYHAITWGENTQQAIDEISELGFRGIQIRRADWEKYSGRAGDFKALMSAKKLAIVSISTGDLTIKPETAKPEIEDCMAMAKWMKDVGGLYLQATDGVRIPGYRFNPEDCKRLGKQLNEIGKRTLGEHGIKLAYHNQLNSLGERRGEVDRILEATDPKYVWVVPDLAHIHVAEGDPIKFVRDYITRIAYPHFKDALIHQPWGKTLDGSIVRPKYDFVELGQGKVNIPGVLLVLKDFRYNGWIIIELDRSPAGRTAKESAVISKRYVEEKLKLKI